MTNIINPSAEAKIIISGDDIPFGAYQAIYHKITQKVEKCKKSYNDAYDIRFGDVENIYNRIEQLLKQYQVKAKRCQITQD